MELTLRDTRIPKAILIQKIKITYFFRKQKVGPERKEIYNAFLNCVTKGSAYSSSCSLNPSQKENAPDMETPEIY